MTCNANTQNLPDLLEGEYNSILASYRDAGPPQSVKNNGVYFSRFFSDIQEIDAWRLREPLEFQPNRLALNVPE